MHFSANSSIDSIIFDLGGVLIDWNPRYLYRKVFVDPGAMEFFLTKVCHGTWNHEQDRGRPWREAIEERVRAFPDYELEIRMYFDRWSEMLAGPVQGSVETLLSLSRARRHRLLALTNWSAETWPIARQRYEFLDVFEGILVSGEEGLAKPETAIFQLMCDRFDLVPGRTLFIDDTEKNVDAARAFGLHAIHFHHALQLREELEDWI